jgi:hypothetical protein
VRCQPRPDRVVAQKLRSSEPLSHDRHERSMIFRIENLGVRLRWVVVLLVGENRHDVGIRAVLVEVLRERTSPTVVQFVTEHQDSAPAKADLQQCGDDRSHACNVIADRRERLFSGCRQS